MFGCATNALAVLLVLLASSAGQAQSSNVTYAARSNDLVVRGFDQPLRVRLHVTLDGLPWEESLKASDQRRLHSMFEQLDSDGNGRLSTAEARRVPPPRSLGKHHEERGIFVAFNHRVLDANNDGGATLDELSAYVSEYVDPALSLELLDQPQISGRPLFDLLDSDGDGRLTSSEWLDLQPLQKLDVDADKVLTNSERNPSTSSGLGPEFVAAPLSQKKTHARLSVELSPSTATPADIAVHIRFSERALNGKAGQSEKNAEIRVELREGAKSLGASVGRVDDHGVFLQVEGNRIVLRKLPPAFRRELSSRQEVMQAYNAAAERSDRSVPTAGDLPDILKKIVALADANMDGGVDRAEIERCLKGYLATSLAAEATRLRVTVCEQRRGLDALIDRNLDGRLSARELSHLPEQLSDLAATPEFIKRYEVPTTTSIVLRRGPFGQPWTSELQAAGPPWFSRADRNQDGDLGEDEFFGDPDEFQRLDANGDGWIDLLEAIRADRQRQRDASDPPAGEGG